MSSNTLARSASPYLRQHAENPVHWMEWGEEAFAKAKAEDRPIFLSIGYAACHWCHVMAHESFEDAATAEVLNAGFIAVKVDREERPDVDQIYMSALHALGEQGGWPLSMFLDTEGRPFWGGTYFPPETRYGRPGFKDVLRAVQATWETDRSRIEHNTRGLSEHLTKALAPPPGSGEISRGDVDNFCERLLSLADQERGGLSGAPKFPNAPITEAHYRASLRTGSAEQRNAFALTLTGMAQGGIYDHVGGGLARYSTDAHWLVPHFEKMLYDNAHFLEQAAWLGGPLMEERIVDTIGWLKREMLTTQGFAASLDADTPTEHGGEEGLTYTWTPEEIAHVLEGEAPAFVDAFRMNGDASFEGRWIPHRHLVDPPLSPELRSQVQRLRDHRAERTQPARDDKVLTDWNMSMVQALVACRHIVPDAQDLAREVFDRVRTDPTSAVHSRLGDASVAPALLSDHVETALAALRLFGSEPNPDWVTLAEAHLTEILSHYVVDGLPVLTHDESHDLIVRPSAFPDDPSPSPASRLSILMSFLEALGREVDQTFKAKLEGALASHLEGANFGTAGAANAIDTALRVSTLVLHEAPENWRAAVTERTDPARLVVHSSHARPLPDWHPASLLCHGAEPVAVLCEGRTCRPAARTTEALAALLS